jgi:hypothetical protein
MQHFINGIYNEGFVMRETDRMNDVQPRFIKPIAIIWFIESKKCGDFRRQTTN